METVFEYVDTENMYVSSDRRKIINQVLKYFDERPDQVEILALPENNDGMIYAKVPVSWLKFHPTKQYSDEAIERMRQVGKNMSEARKAQLAQEEDVEVEDDDVTQEYLC